MKKIILVVLITSFILSSCSNQPECSSEDAKTTAHELAEELVLTDVAYDEFINVYVRQKGGYFIENLATIQRISVENIL